MLGPEGLGTAAPPELDSCARAEPVETKFSAIKGMPKIKTRPKLRPKRAVSPDRISVLYHAENRGEILGEARTWQHFSAAGGLGLGGKSARRCDRKPTMRALLF